MGREACQTPRQCFPKFLAPKSRRPQPDKVAEGFSERWILAKLCFLLIRRTRGTSNSLDFASRIIRIYFPDQSAAAWGAMGKKGTSQTRPKGGARRGGQAGRSGGRGGLLDAVEALEDGSLRRRLDSAAVVRREESSFSKLQPEFLEQLNLHASCMELKRPIRKSLTIFSHPESSYSEDTSSNEGTLTGRSQRPKPLLLLPKKPRWNHDLSAKAVQSNEKEVFRQWLEKTDEQVQAVFRQARDRKGKGRASDTKEIFTVTEHDAAAAIIPSLFERNLEVYQQLWRVVERSHVLLVLIDVRCPPIHLPPSLEDYLMRQGHSRRRRTILVLTKADLVEDAVAEEWKAWLSERYPQWQVVLTSSYVRREKQEGQGELNFSFLATEMFADLA